MTRSAMNPSSNVLVSVVVPTYRRPQLLSRCLRALCEQTLEPTRYELLIVDDGRDEETRSTVMTFARRRRQPAMRYLTSPRAQSGPAVARNIGWKAARGAVIAFTDDDCHPLPEWLEAGSAPFTDAAVSGAWGRIIVPLPPDPTDYERNTAGLEQAPCATANCFYRRDALQAVGGFDERFTAAWQEDSDLQFALLERRHKLVEAADAVVVHPVRPARWGISVHQQRNNLFNALLFKKHPALYRAWIQASPPWHYYANAVALVGTAAGWTLESLWLLAPALAVWIASVGQFCAKRLRSTSRQAKHIAEMIVTSALIPPVAIYWRLRGAIKYRVAFF